MSSPPQQPEFGVAGELRTLTRVVCGTALIYAFLGAGLAGEAADWLTLLNDPNYDAGLDVSVPCRTASLRRRQQQWSPVRAIPLWWGWRRSGTALVWNERGLAYRASPKVHGTLPWRHVSEIKPVAESSEVLITGDPPDHDPDFTLTVNTAGTRSGQRTPACTHTQQELIDALETSRIRCVDAVPPAPPAVPSAQRFPRVMVLIWVLIAAGMTAFLVSFDQSPWFMTITGG